MFEFRPPIGRKPVTVTDSQGWVWGFLWKFRSFHKTTSTKPFQDFLSNIRHVLQREMRLKTIGERERERNIYLSQFVEENYNIIKRDRTSLNRFNCLGGRYNAIQVQTSPCKMTIRKTYIVSYAMVTGLSSLYLCKRWVILQSLRPQELCFELCSYV